MPKIELTNFAKRQWEPKFSGTKMHKVNMDHFMDQANTCYDFALNGSPNMGRWNLMDHPKPDWHFCKYLVFENFDPEIKASVVKIDHTMYQYIQSGYSSRTDKELAVLSRWVSFPSGSYTLPTARFTGLVLYSKKQLLEEHNAGNAGGSVEFELSNECRYGIVAIMGLTQAQLDPMPPITHLRNALGKDHGGNGTPIDVEEYNKSVDFWSKHILVK